MLHQSPACRLRKRMRLRDRVTRRVHNSEQGGSISLSERTMRQEEWRRVPTLYVL